MKTYSIVSVVAAAAATLLTALPAAASGVGEGTPGYPAPVSASSQATSPSRAAVQAEARLALAEGRIASGELGLPEAEFHAQADRARVRAEAAEALRLGLVASGEASVVYTPAQLEAIRLAGDRVQATIVAATR